MRVSCPSCEAPIPAADVNLDNLVAKCRRCDEVFSISDRIGRVEAPRRRPPLPKGLTIERGEPPLPDDPGYREAPSREVGELVVRRRWWHWTVIFLTLWCVAWDGFLLFWYAAAIGSGDLMMWLFPLLHVAVGVAISYWVIATWLNTTTLRVADGSLTVRHGPIPWMGNRAIPVAQLRQLYVRKRSPRSRRSGTYGWEVHAETHDHRAVKLIKGLRERDQAEYIEWVIEQHLGIEDDPSMNDR